MGLKELYDSWQFKAGNSLGANKTPKQQQDGQVAVDFLPNTYQNEVRNRIPGNKVVTQATADDATNGTFNTSTAFRYYSTLVASPLKTFKSKVVHLYNGQGNDSTKYVTSNKVKNTPGALYINNP